MMRAIEDWTIVDLQRFIDDEVQESLTLDYKRSAALSKDNHCRNELVKDVSAFANSAGGMIIYGITEEDSLPRGIDEGVEGGVTREWIEQVLNSRIQPRIQGVIIKAVPLSSGRNAYVIDVPQATVFAPHQAGDKKYYKRFNFASEPMEDYEIRDALRRGEVAHPLLQLSSIIKGRGDNHVQVRLRADITNLSDEPALYVGIVLNIDSRLVRDGDSPVGWGSNPGGTAHIQNVEGVREVDILALSRNIMPANHMPIFKEQTWKVLDIELDVMPFEKYVFGVRVSCPGFRTEMIGVASLGDAGFIGDDALSGLFVPHES